MNNFDIKDKMTQILVLVVLTMLISIYGAYQATQANKNAYDASVLAEMTYFEALGCTKAD